MRVEDLQRRLLSSNYFKDDCSAEEHSILYGEICSLREPVDPEYEAALDEIERIKSKTPVVDFFSFLEIEFPRDLLDYVENLKEKDRSYLLFPEQIKGLDGLCCQISRAPAMVPVVLKSKVYDFKNLLALPQNAEGKRELAGTLFSLNELKPGDEVSARLQEYYERVIEPAIAEPCDTQLAAKIAKYVDKKEAKNKLNLVDSIKFAVMNAVDQRIKKGNLSLAVLNGILKGIITDDLAAKALFEALGESKAGKYILAVYAAMGVELSKSDILSNKLPLAEQHEFVAEGGLRLSRKIFEEEHQKYVETQKMVNFIFAKLGELERERQLLDSEEPRDKDWLSKRSAAHAGNLFSNLFGSLDNEEAKK